MKKILVTVTTLLFAGTINAASDEAIYHGFAKGNPDLEAGSSYSIVRSAVQPGIGSGSGVLRSRSVSDNQIYHGFERGNPDLWSGSARSRYSVAVAPGIGSRASVSRHSVYTDNDVYHGFEMGNPDL